MYLGFKSKKGPFLAIPETSTLNINKAEIDTHTYTHTPREREGERERIIDQKTESQIRKEEIGRAHV